MKINFYLKQQFKQLNLTKIKLQNFLFAVD